MNQTTIELKSLNFARHGLLLKKQLWANTSCGSELRLADGLHLSRRHFTTINYAQVYERVKNIFWAIALTCWEAAETIVIDLLENFPLLAEVSIKIRKPSVPVDCICVFSVKLHDVAESRPLL